MISTRLTGIVIIPILILILSASLVPVSGDYIEEYDAKTAIEGSESLMYASYAEVRKIEEMGAETGNIIDGLNIAGDFLTKAYSNYRTGRYNETVNLVGKCNEYIKTVNKILESKKALLESLQPWLKFNTYLLYSGTVAIAGLFGWLVLKWRQYSDSLTEKSRREHSRKTLGFRVLLSILFIILILLGALLIPSVQAYYSRGEASFSELWVLGPRKTISDYPSNIEVGKSYEIFAGVNNNMKHSMFYDLRVLLISSSKNSSLYDFYFFLEDDVTWESPLNFTVIDVSQSNNSCNIKSISLNGVNLVMNHSSDWDPIHHGFYYRLFLELWYFDLTTHKLQYHDRFVSIWLNMTI